MDFLHNLVSPNSFSSVQSVDIVLDRPSRTFTTGEVITGNCFLNVTGSLHFSQIELSFVGKSRVRFTETKSNSATSHSVTDSETYVQECHLLDMKYNPGNFYNTTLTSGRHAVGFNFIVPNHLPATFSCIYGFIRYKLKIKINGKKFNKGIEVNILSNSLVSPDEFNAPKSIFNKKTVGLFGGKKVHLTCNIPQTGYFLGTSIPVNCHIENESHKSMILKGSLKQEIIAKARHRQRIITNKIHAIDGQQVLPNSTNDQLIHVPIPIGQPIVHNSCPIIQINYYVNVKLDIPGSFDLHCRIPVILTNYPVNS